MTTILVVWTGEAKLITNSTMGLILHQYMIHQTLIQRYYKSPGSSNIYAIFLFKVALFYGDNDWLAAEDDVAWLAFQLPNLAERYKNPWVGWNHFDFLYAIDIDEYQNNHLLEVLKKYPIS